MSDTGDFELFGAPAAKEADEKSDEQFNDQMRQTQQALAQLWKEEKKAKGHDNRLAQIIIQFLGQPGNTDLFLLISRAIGQNIPSELILAVISLIDRQAEEEVKGFLQAGKEPISKALVTAPRTVDFNALTAVQKQRIDEWILAITVTASSKPHRTLESLIIKKMTGEQMIREISPVLIQLSAFILRNYLNSQKVSFEFEAVYEFMQKVFITLVKNLEELLKGQKHLNPTS